MLVHIKALGGALLLLTVALPAQITKSNQLVGWTSSPLLPSSGQIRMQDVDGGCQPVRTICASSLLNTTSAWAGGTAYDPRYQAVWNTDDRMLELRRLGDCQVLCVVAPQRMPSFTISGLALSDHKRLMFQLETIAGSAVIETYDVRSCPPGQAALRPCTLTLAPNAQAGGIAYDEVRDLLYVSSSERLLGGYKHLVHVVKLAPTSPCGTFVCTYAFADCSPSLSGMPITGLGYDACSRILYATSGNETRSLKVIDPLSCSFADLGCCPAQGGGGVFMGLDVVPGWSRVDLGRSCLGTPCASCPAMRADLEGGDPSLGNQEFGAVLTGAPSGAQGFFVVGAGPCTVGTSLPFLCGPLWFSPTAPLVVVSVSLNGTGCAAGARLGLPIPIDLGLCGGTVCTQWLLLCPNNGIGLSNAIQFDVTGS